MKMPFPGIKVREWPSLEIGYRLPEVQAFLSHDKMLEVIPVI